MYPGANTCRVSTGFDMKKLLIVDDDEAFCEALKRAMQRRNFQVSIALTAKEAVQVAASQELDYAVVDLRLGEDSGLKVVEALAERVENIRMVVLTGYASITTAVQAIKLGAIQYLTKPADADEIVRAMKQLQADAEVEVAEKPMSPRRLEWEHINAVLAQHQGNVSATARALGIHRRSLQRKLQKKPAKR